MNFEIFIGMIDVVVFGRVASTKVSDVFRSARVGWCILRHIVDSIINQNPTIIDLIAVQ